MPDGNESGPAALDASRLYTASPTEESPNRLSPLVCLPRKRKLLTEDDGALWLGGPITIHPYSSQDGEPEVLQPSRLVNRSTLPLAYLAPIECQGPTLFSAHIWALERDGRWATDGEYKVLLAQSSKDGQCFAIERVGKRVYALCGLAKWVSLEDVGRRPVKIPRLKQQTSSNESDKAVWWREACVTEPSEEVFKPTSRRDAILRLSVKSQSGAETISGSAILPPVEASGDESNLAATEPYTIPTPSNPAIDSVRNDAIGDLQSQYLEALYVSKAPLAYFVKGPVSRARVANGSASANLEREPDLLEVLQSSILSVKEKGGSAKVDKKYAASVPDLIKEIPPGSHVEDDDGQSKFLFTEKYKRSKKRKRINPDGFFPAEESHIVNWWLRREVINPESGAEDSQEKRIRTACSYQKPREIQLQIILILEIMALLGQRKTETTVDGDANQGASTGPKVNPKKEKKTLDYPKILDVMLEKLQIWETTNQSLLDAGATGSKSSTDSKRQLDSSAEDNCLRSFCTDVIIPFYAPRLPDVSRSICQKLGATVPSPPRKSFVRSSSSTKLPSKPSAPIRSRRPLARVVTEDNTMTRRLPPSLLRSATDTSVPFFKQELDDTTFSRKSTPQPTLQQAHRYTQREVDLHAEARATEAKLKRKLAIEQEIQGAINTLKRPNARLAVQEFVDASDQRHTTSKKLGKSRKSQNPVFNPFALGGVQVTATPKAVRQKQIRALARAHSEQLPALPEFTADSELPTIPPSSDPKIPSSSVRPRAMPTLSRSQSQMVSRSSNRYLGNSLRRSSSQISITATPTRPRTANHLSQSSWRLTSMLELSDNDGANDGLEDENDDMITLPKLPAPKKPPSSASIHMNDESNRGGRVFKRPGLPKVRQTPVKAKQGKKEDNVAAFITPQKPTSRSVDAASLPRTMVNSLTATPVKSRIGTEVIDNVVAESSPARPQLDAGAATTGERLKAGNEEITVDNALQVDGSKAQEGEARNEGDGDGNIYAALGWDGEGADLL